MDDDELLLIDPDLFILLSASGLLDRVVELLGFPIENVRRLAALPFMLKSSRQMRKKYPEELRNKVLSDCDRIPGLDDAPTDADVMDRLIQIDRIDDGEVLLYASVHEQKCWLLGSGDKRAMTALATAESVADVRDGIAGRVISLEVVCELLLKADDVNTITKAFLPLKDVNVTLKSVFGSGGPFKTEDRLEAVASYHRDLEKTVGKDFLYRVESD